MVDCKRSDFVGLSAELLGGGSYLRFQAKGWSMRPLIHDGDFITVSPIENSAVKVGDVVFYTLSEGRVMVHRVINKYKKDSSVTMLIKGDATFSPPDKVDSRNVLGKVVAIERNGHKRNLDTRFYQTLNLLFARISPLSYWIYPIGSRLKRSGRRLLGDMLRELQSFKLYCILVKNLMKGDIDYQIKDSEDAGYRLVAKRKDKIIGGVTLTKFPEGGYPYVGWWLFGMSVNWPYRRIGLGEELTRMAMEVAAKDGISEIRLLVFEDAKHAINLYQKLGFRRISMPELDKQLEEEAKKGSRRRIILARDINSG